MSHLRLWILIGAAVAGLIPFAACETAIQVGDGPADIPAPDGIDPKHPDTERATLGVDFAGVRTVRIDVPTGRVSLSQSDGGSEASLKVTEIILKEGLPNDVLADLLIGSAITAERSFVDDARLDIEATLAEGLADADIVFDIRLVIPGGANAEILLGNGPVEIAGLTGNVEIQTANGAVTVGPVTGNVVAKTTERTVTVTDVTGNVQAQTSAADMMLRLSPPKGGVVSARTSDGAIRLTIAQTTAANIDLSAPEGVVSANLAGFAVSNLTTGNGFLSGVLNGGGGRIEAVAEGGEIEFVGM